MSAGERRRVAVVGAGVLGSAVAARLALDGAEVALIDPGGENASSVAAGMIAPAFEAVLEPTSATAAGLYAQARELWPEFAAKLGLDLVQDGADWFGPAEPMAGQLSAMGFPCERRPGGLHAPGEARIAPGPALARLAAAVEAHGGRRIIAAVDRLDAEGGEVRVGWPGGGLIADSLVLATGWRKPAVQGEPAWVDALYAEITPIKGQIVTVAGPAAAAVPHVQRAPGVYLAPSPHGLLKVGATMEPGLSDDAVDPATIARLIERAAVSIAPDIATAQTVQAKAGVRGSTSDSLPLAGAAGPADLFCALAPRRNGWLLAPLVVQVVCDAMAGKAPSPAAAAFDPARFNSG